MSASASLGGATSKDVDRGLGHPILGETSNELHHGGQYGGKHQREGLEGVGTSYADRYERYLPEDRGVERQHATPHGDRGAQLAEDRDPVQAEQVAHEFSQG